MNAEMPVLAPTRKPPVPQMAHSVSGDQVNDRHVEAPRNPEVLILLATFNGEKYLSDQLTSIERQTHRHWRIFASDDGSTDATPARLEAFRSRHADRVAIWEGPVAGSAKGNFFGLLHAAPPARYVAFSDQDDVWVDDKLDRLVAACQRLERRVGPGVPCAVFSDLRVVDETLQVRATSFCREINSRPERVSFGSLLVENAIPGCSMLVNSALANEFRSYRGPLEDARMHDWWLALLAAGMGAISFVPDQLVLYRQHSQNAAGSVHRRGVAFAWAKLLRGDRGDIRASIQQAKLLLAAHGSHFPTPTFRQLSAFAELDRTSKMRRVLVCLRHRILKQTADRRIYQLMRI
jgi:glycosyltransferase involved in cell wall biosynthesis